MTRHLPMLVLAMAAALSLGACANTVRGIGQDAANTVNATQNAAENVATAAQ